MSAIQPQEPPVADATIDPDSITLVILSPSPEVNNGRMTYPKIPLATTISQLKDRIQNDLPASPPPQQQRLIYRGHALLAGEFTLRQVLRGQHNPSEYSSSYTLHLVLPPTNAPAGSLHRPPYTAPAIPAGFQAVGNGQGQQAAPRSPNSNAQQTLAHTIDPLQNIQHQINLLQQQMLANNTAVGSGHHGQPMHNAMQITYQLTGGQMPQLIGAQNVPVQGQAQIPFPPGFFPAPPNVPNLQEILARQQMMRAQAGMNAAQNQNPTTTQTNPALEQMSLGTEQANTTGSVPNSRVQESVGPNGERVRIIVRETNLQPSRQNTPVIVDTAAPATESVSDTSSAHVHPPGHNSGTRPTSSGPPGIHQNPSRISPRHLPHPFATPPSSSTGAASQTTAWLLSSPSGPQALLFAPGHGYFASPSTQTSARLAPARATRLRNNARATPSPTPVVPSPQSLPDPPANAVSHDAANSDEVADQGALPLQQQLQVQAAAQNPRNAPNDENDMFNVIVQRGWLFLRLYMFTFVLSEAGTWRRWFLLALAIFACLLPRDNPLNNLIAAVRRHIDNLVGPPPPARPQAGTQRGIAAAGARDNTGTPGGLQGPVDTPEETAARLVRNHRQRNTHILRDTLFRIERAVALFLASLVPGVGERHVQAREEARRVETEERERVVREAEERANQTQQDPGRDRGNSSNEPKQLGAEGPSSMPEASIGEGAAIGTSTDTR